MTEGETISNPRRPRVPNSGTAPRYRICLVTLPYQLSIAIEDELELADDAAVLLGCLLFQVKELSGDLRYSDNLYPCCSAGSPAERACYR